MPEETFQVVKPSSARKKREKSDENPYLKLQQRFSARLDTIRQSDVFHEITKYLDTNTPKWTILRCVALGSPSTEPQALNQLCLLKLISCKYEISIVSLWDPAFTDLDKKFFSEELKYTVEDKFELTPFTLYYMPHAPISVLERIFTDEMPRWMLTNDLTVYGNKYTKEEYFEKYPQCSRISNLALQLKTPQKPKEDDFQTVTIKKRKRKNKYVITEPEIDYNYSQCYFDKLVFNVVESGNASANSWSYSFSDLCYYLLTKL